MPGRFEGRTAVITGGARGIGYATAALFAKQGARVAVCDLDGAAVERAAGEIATASGGEVVGLACDVSDAAVVEDAMRRIADRLQSLDILINNAGVTRDNLVHKLSEDDWDAVMGVHLRGAFLCSRAAQRLMVPQRWGKIVNLSSTSALGNRGQLNYSTAKAGLQGFTRTLALELGRFNINVNAVAPGFIDTEMTRATAARLGHDPEDYKAQRAQAIPLGRVGEPRDVANVIAFLCSEEASFVSGQVIYVAGGPETRR